MKTRITLQLPTATANRLKTCCRRLQLEPEEVFEYGLALLFPAKAATAQTQTLALVAWDHVFSALPKKIRRPAKL